MKTKSTDPNGWRDDDIMTVLNRCDRLLTSIENNPAVPGHEQLADFLVQLSGWVENFYTASQAEADKIIATITAGREALLEQPDEYQAAVQRQKAQVLQTTVRRQQFHVLQGGAS